MRVTPLLILWTYIFTANPTHASAPFLNIQALEKKGLLEHHLKNPPWSGDYWPTYRGGIAFPYTDTSIHDPVAEAIRKDLANESAFEPVFEPINDYGIDIEIQRSFFEKMRARLIDIQKKVADRTLSLSELETLAPLEKYELFLGEIRFPLSMKALQQSGLTGSQYSHGRDTTVNIWKGLCHGWAAASLAEPRPTSLKWIRSLNSQYLIPFYPEDIKAIYTYIYPMFTKYAFSVLGRRCRNDSPFSNSQEKSGCEDVSPIDFHRLMVQGVGEQNEKFAVDIDPKVTIWNYPIAGYTYDYYHVLWDPRKSGTRKLADARLLASELKPYDVFLTKRHANTHTIVGIRFGLQLTKDTLAAHRKTNSLSNDVRAHKIYFYDLELDQQANIIGGQWRGSSNQPYLSALGMKPKWDADETPDQPDFFWKARRIESADMKTPEHRKFELFRKAVQ